MKETHQLAKRIEEVLLNGKWIANTNYKELLSTISWKQANTEVGSLNTIALLAFHVNYYIGGLVDFFEKGSLDIRDKYSFEMPEITSQEEWERLLKDMWSNSEKFAAYIEEMPDEKLGEVFIDEKYGDYRRNMDGVIEHCYYHLGQISLIKKLVLDEQ